MRWLMLAPLLVAGCAGGESDELACQNRIAGVWEQSAEADTFGAKRYAAVNRSGCTAKQLATLDRFMAVTSALPRLTEASDKAGQSGNEARHMAAFQAMNGALIELSDLQRDVRADVERMSNR